MSAFIERMIRAAKLDVNLYEEVEADTTATSQAMGVVLLSALAAGIGSLSFGPVNAVIVAVIALVGWYLWAYLIYFIGTKFLPEPQTSSTHGELLRTIGFSCAPGLIRVVALIPGLARIVFTGTGIWMVVAMVIGVRQALDYKSTGRAVAVCLIGWLIQAALFAFLLSAAGAGGEQAM